jgi:hypothetical protein
MLTGDIDTISDGSGSFNYKNGSICMWRIEPPGATEVTINFLDFDTEESKDLVKIYDAGSNQLLATYSGTYDPDELPGPVTSPSGKMMVTFSTNMTVTKGGWTAWYYANVVGYSETDPIFEELKVYPNPVKDYLFFGLNLSESQNVDVLIYDIKGGLIFKDRLVYTDGKKTEKIDFSGYSQGVYTIRIIGKEQVYVFKVVKTNE